MFHKIFFYYFYKHFKRKLSRLQTKKINNKKQCFELILKKLWIVLRCWACIDCVVAWMMYILGTVGNCVDPYSHIHIDSILDANDSPRKFSRGWSFGISFLKWGARWPLRSTSYWGVSSSNGSDGRSGVLYLRPFYFFFFCGLNPLVLKIELGFCIVPGGFGRIALAGGDTLAANSFTLFNWIPCFDSFGISYVSLVVGAWLAVVLVGDGTTMDPFEVDAIGAVNFWFVLHLLSCSCHRCSDSWQVGEPLLYPPQLLAARVFTASSSFINRDVGDKYGNILSVSK